MAALVLKQIEKGFTSIVTSATSVTVTLGTTLTNTAKTILLFSIKCNSSSPVNYNVRGSVNSTTQIQFYRDGSPGVTVDIEYAVIEFTSGITVQHLTFTQSSGTVNTAISTVDTAKTFPIITMATEGLTYGSDDLISAEITSATNLRTVVDTSATQAVNVQVIQIDDAAVQKFSDTYGGGATKDVTVSSITESKTLWFFSMTAGVNINTDDLPYLSYVNSTTLRFSRGAASGYSWPFILYVVGLSSGVIVQNISTVIASGNTSVSPTISTVNAAKTALLLNGQYQRWATVNNEDDHAGEAMPALSGLTATQFTATRAASPALSATTNVQVLTFDGRIDTGHLFGKCFEDAFEPCME